jgi:hypothetical protein
MLLLMYRLLNSAIAGFLMCNTPVCIDLMGWGKAGGDSANAAASV